MNKVIVFDIDGTLANIEHRRGFVASKPKNFKAFNAAIPQDTPHEEIVWLSRALFTHNTAIVLCSGRGEEEREVTEKQMKDFGVTFDKLYMRSKGDFRKDSIVKVELLQQIKEDFGTPYIWFDDRQQVVDAIRAQGIKVCQVAPGDF